MEKTLDFKFLNGDLKIKLSSFSYYPCEDYSIWLGLTFKMTPELRANLAFNPYSVRVFMNERRMNRCYNRYLDPPPDTLSPDEYTLSLCFCGNPISNDQSNIDTETNTGLELRILLDSLIQYRGEFLYIDTIYAIEKKKCTN